MLCKYEKFVNTGTIYCAYFGGRQSFKKGKDDCIRYVTERTAEILDLWPDAISDATLVINNMTRLTAS